MKIFISTGSTYAKFIDPKSDAFVEWFDGSKVCLNRKRPLRLFRGITESREVRHPSSSLGIFMTTDLNIARAYAGTKGEVQELYAAIKRPFVSNTSFLQSIISPADAVRVRKHLIRSGYDGIFIKPDHSDMPPSYISEYIAFTPDQVRRAS